MPQHSFVVVYYIPHGGRARQIKRGDIFFTFGGNNLMRTPSTISGILILTDIHDRVNHFSSDIHSINARFAGPA